MREFRTRREVETTAFVREMAAYFADFEPGAGNHYTTLLDGVFKRGQVGVLATLNYDLLLEHAISRLGWSVAYRAPAPAKNVLVLKLHGSCNFLPDMQPQQISGIGFDLSAAPDASILHAPIRAVGPHDVLEFCRREDSIAPAMALYAEGKAVLYCAQFVTQVQADWREAVKRAKRIYLIGVRPYPADTHVWGPLARKGPPIWYVGPSGADFLDWAKGEGRRNAHHLSDDFGQSLPQIFRMLSRWK